MSLLNIFRADTYKFRKLLLQCQREWAHLSPQHIRTMTGYTPDEITKLAAEEEKREALEPTKNAMKLRVEFEEFEQRVLQAEAESQALEYRHRNLYDTIAQDNRVAEELSGMIANHPAEVAAAKATSAQAGFDMLVRGDDPGSRISFNNAVQFLAVESQQLAALKAALELCRAKITAGEKELAAIK